MARSCCDWPVCGTDTQPRDEVGPPLLRRWGLWDAAPACAFSGGSLGSECAGSITPQVHWSSWSRPDYVVLKLTSGHFLEVPVLPASFASLGPSEGAPVQYVGTLRGWRRRAGQAPLGARVEGHLSELLLSVVVGRGSSGCGLERRSVQCCGCPTLDSTSTWSASSSHWERRCPPSPTHPTLKGCSPVFV